jgi:hypothetical protein
LEAENRDLRNRVIQLAFQIQILRHAGSADDRARSANRSPRLSGYRGRPLVGR